MFFQAQVYFFQFSVFFASGALSWVQIPQGTASWTFVWEWQALFVLMRLKAFCMLIK